jgi:hypothetical protein
MILSAIFFSLNPILIVLDSTEDLHLGKIDFSWVIIDKENGYGNLSPLATAQTTLCFGR